MLKFVEIVMNISIVLTSVAIITGLVMVTFEVIREFFAGR